MAIEVFNRTEKKYLIDDATYRQLRVALEPYMEADAHSRGEDGYLICNIYYDTPDNELIRRSLDKPLYKEKLRLRSYGPKDLSDKVFLEVKKKYNGIVYKRRTKILLGDAYRFVENGRFTNEDGTDKLPKFMNAQVTKELTYFINFYQGIRPALYLSYERQALFGRDDPELRITFDHKITARKYDLGLHYGNYGEQYLQENMWVMELKVNQAMPLWLSALLNAKKIYPTSFSKYGTVYKETFGKI